MTLEDKNLTIGAIDDNEHDLYFLRRNLEKIPGWKVAFVGFSDPDQGLDELVRHHPDLIFLDYFVEAKTGLDLLRDLREVGFDQPAILLTGQGNETTAVEAMRAGAADYLPKGTLTPNILQQAVNNAIEKHQLRTSLQKNKETLEETNKVLALLIEEERVLLAETLNKSLEALTQLLSIVNPQAFGRSARIKRYVSVLAKQMGLEETWHIEIAALLSQIGWVTLPTQILTKISHGENLTPEEHSLYWEHPRIGSELIMGIPRMKDVAEIIAYQEKHFDGTGVPADNRKGEDIPVGARLLKVALDLDAVESEEIQKRRLIKN